METINCKETTASINKLKSLMDFFRSQVKDEKIEEAVNQKKKIQIELDKIDEILSVDWKKIEKLKDYKFDGEIEDAIESKDGRTLTVSIREPEVISALVHPIVMEKRGIEVLDKETKEVLVKYEDLKIDLKNNLAESLSGDRVIWVDYKNKINFARKNSAAVEKVEIYAGIQPPLVATKDGKHVITGSDRGSVRLWDIEKKEIVQTYVCNKFGMGMGVSAISESQDGMEVIVACKHGTSGMILAFNKQTGREIFREETDTEVSFPLLDTKDGKKIVATVGLSVVIWDKKTGKKDDLELTKYVEHLIETNDGKYLIVGDDYGKIIAWDKETKKEVWWKSISNSGSVTDLCQIDDDCALASFGDGSAIIFKITTGELVRQLFWNHKERITKVMLGLNKREVLTCSQDGTIAVWGIPKKKGDDGI